MGCLPWLIGGIAWVVIAAITDSGWIGFGVGLSVGITTAIIASRFERRDTSLRTKPPEISNTQRLSYLSHCWYCKSPIASVSHRKCTKCGWYICSECKECGCRYKRFQEARSRHL